MKSIRTKITLCLILTVLIGLVASGSSSISLTYNGADDGRDGSPGGRTCAEGAGGI